MILRGILDRSLSNQICIRGFARIKELARISKANKAYQRELVDKQEQVVSNFLSDENELLFFPEVILSLKLKYDNTKKGANISATPIQKIELKNNFTSNIDSLKIRVSKKQYNSSFDNTERDQILNVEIEFDDVELIKLINSKEHPLHRIDGNHRLSAAEQISSSRIDNMNIPFCIVLFEEIHETKFDTTLGVDTKVCSRKYEKFEKVVFNNINFKSLPLTQEQNLKVILDDVVNFPDDEIKNLFGASWIYTRQLCNDKIKIENFSGIKHLLENNYRTYARNIFEILIANEHDEANIVGDVFESLKAIEQLYKSEKKLDCNKSEGLFAAFLFYHVTSKIKFNFFKDWVLYNNIFEIQEAKTETIIQIFDKVADQTITVFVAMPFYSVAEVNAYNKAYSRVIEKLKSGFESLKIDLYPIMHHEGETYNINNKMIEQISECNIFIADISNTNVNVAFELGYARSIKKQTIMIKRESDKNKTPFDYEQDMCHSYNNNAIDTLEEIVENNIKAILSKIGFVFNN